MTEVYENEQTKNKRDKAGEMERNGREKEERKRIGTRDTQM